MTCKRTFPVIAGFIIGAVVTTSIYSLGVKKIQYKLVEVVEKLTPEESRSLATKIKESNPYIHKKASIVMSALWENAAGGGLLGAIAGKAGSKAGGLTNKDLIDGFMHGIQLIEEETDNDLIPLVDTAAEVSIVVEGNRQSDPVTGISDKELEKIILEIEKQNPPKDKQIEAVETEKPFTPLDEDVYGVDGVDEVKYSGIETNEDK